MKAKKSIDINADLRKKEQKKKRLYFFLSLNSVVLFFVVWYLASDVFHVFSSMALPGPIKVFQAMIKKMTVRAPDGGTLPEHIWASLSLVFYGYFLGGLIGNILGIIMGWYRKADMLITPIFYFVRPIPPIAWIPIMMVLFGLSFTAKASIIFIGTFSGCLVNAYTGIKATKDVHIWVAQTFGASKLYTLFHVAIPAALPKIFTGLNLALTTAWMSLVAAEMLAASKGLGYMMQYNRQMGRADNIIVSMVVIAIIGAILTFLMNRLEKILIKGRRL